MCAQYKLYIALFSFPEVVAINISKNSRSNQFVLFNQSQGKKTRLYEKKYFIFRLLDAEMIRI